MKQEFYSSLVESMIEKFKRAAIVYHFGCQDDDKAMEKAGFHSLGVAMLVLDDLAAGRRFLVPLLDDPDPSIRVFAAGYLVKIMPERALPVLKELEDTCLTEARMTACHMLIGHKHGELKL